LPARRTKAPRKKPTAAAPAARVKLRKDESKIVRKLWGEIDLPPWDATAFYDLFRRRREAVEAGGELSDVEMDRYVRLMMRLIAMRFKQRNINFRLEDRKLDPVAVAAYVLHGDKENAGLLGRTRKMRLRAELAIELEDRENGRWWEYPDDVPAGSSEGPCGHGTARLPKEGPKLMLQAFNTTLYRLVHDYERRNVRHEQPVSASSVAGSDRHGPAYLDQGFCSAEVDVTPDYEDLAAQRVAFLREQTDEVCLPLVKGADEDTIAVAICYRYCLLWQRCRQRMPTHDELPKRLRRRIRYAQLTLIKCRTRDALGRFARSIVDAH
jgi:hypothetical protein